MLQQTITHSVNQSSQAYSQCASMRRRARLCALIRVHALQCAPMRLLVQPSEDRGLHKEVNFGAN